MRHTDPRYARLWRHNELIYSHYHTWRFCQQFDSKHDVTMVSDSQATLLKCNDYSGSNMRSFCSMWGRHDTIVIDCNYESFCWVHFWTSIATWVSDVDGAIIIIMIIIMIIVIIIMIILMIVIIIIIIMMIMIKMIIIIRIFIMIIMIK